MARCLGGRTVILGRPRQIRRDQRPCVVGHVGRGGLPGQAQNPRSEPPNRRIHHCLKVPHQPGGERRLDLRVSSWNTH